MLHIVIVIIIGMGLAEDDLDTEDEMTVSGEDQVLADTESDDTIIEDLEQSDADTYLLFTRPVFEEKASIGKFI